jgi:hypothetical protein
VIVIIMAMAAQPVSPQRPFVAIPVGRRLPAVVPTIRPLVAPTELVARRRIAAALPVRLRRRRLIATVLCK